MVNCMTRGVLVLVPAYWYTGLGHDVAGYRALGHLCLVLTHLLAEPCPRVAGCRAGCPRTGVSPLIVGARA